MLDATGGGGGGGGGNEKLIVKYVTQTYEHVTG